MPDAPEHIAEYRVTAPPAVVTQLPFAELPPADTTPALPKKPKRKRQHVIGTRLDDDELARLATKAIEAGLSTGAYIRACALGDAGPRARRRAPVDRELLARANAEMNRAGNNLNQIAHRMNAGDDVLRAAHVRAILELKEVLALYRQAAGYDRQG